MGKLRKKISKDTYVRAFSLHGQKGGTFNYPIYRGRLRGGSFVTRMFAPVFRPLHNLAYGGGLKRIRDRTFNVIKKNAKKRALKAIPSMITGKGSITSFAKKNVPGIAFDLAKKMPGILKDELFRKPPAKKKPKKKKKKAKTSKKPAQKGGGMHALARSSGGLMKRSGARNIFGDDWS